MCKCVCLHGVGRCGVFAVVMENQFFADILVIAFITNLSHSLVCSLEHCMSIMYWTYHGQDHKPCLN